jgi:5-(carboxyamino)imidazole ribonucleotide mutase
MYRVGIVMGSQSDFDIVEKAIDVLKLFDVDIEARVISAHRTPREATEYASTAVDRGIGVIIAVAGKAAHLPGVLAAYTVLPVIGLPIKSSFMDGLDSLLSMVQMPKGVPVATVAVNGAENAALLAVQILALGDNKLADKCAAYKKEMALGVTKQDAAVQKELYGDK